jgi:hypothetical protein
MTFDTGHACQPGGCFGMCHRWYVPYNARDVRDESSRIRVFDRSTLTPEGLSCHRDVYWTR